MIFAEGAPDAGAMAESRQSARLATVPESKNHNSVLAYRIADHVIPRHELADRGQVFHRPAKLGLIAQQPERPPKALGDSGRCTRVMSGDEVAQPREIPRGGACELKPHQPGGSHA